MSSKRPRAMLNRDLLGEYGNANQPNLEVSRGAISSRTKTPHVDTEMAGTVSSGFRPNTLKQRGIESAFRTK